MVYTEQFYVGYSDCGADMTLSNTALLRYFGYVMLALAAFFAVPQVVEGLDGDSREIKKALSWALGSTA